MHSLDIDISDAVIHLQLSCMMTNRRRGVTRHRDKKAHGDLNYVWTQYDTHQPPLYHIPKVERCGNCSSRNLTYKFCTSAH